MTYRDDFEDPALSGGPADAATQLLGDDALQAGGLAPVRAWVRTGSSANAVRVAKSRQKRKLAGVSQLNVLVPDGGRKVVTNLAKHLAAGGNLAAWAAGHLPPSQELTAARAELEDLRARLAAQPPTTPDLSAQLAETQTQLEALRAAMSAAKPSKSASPEIIQQRKSDWERGKKVRLCRGWRRHLARIAGWLDEPQR